ncbi:MAG: 1-phosphofructokinase family hexose kinase [Balneolaceae bacterium]
MILSVCPNPSVDKFLSLPSLHPTGVNRSTGETAYPGGKGVHVALAVNELGSESHLAGIWGGPTGQWVKNECEARGVRCYGPDVRGWTRTCLTLRTAKKHKDTEILERGPEINEEALSLFLNTLEQRIPVAKAVCISGSWPPGTPDDIYFEIKSICESADIPMWVDASGKRLKQAIEVHPYGIHMNKSEARFLMGPAEHPSVYAKKLLNHCSISAVTDGANGLFLANKDTMYHASHPVEHVISSVGSGDCLLAGLLVSQIEGGDLEQMARNGTACGAANCIRPELGMLVEKDVKNFRDNVICKIVA